MAEDERTASRKRPRRAAAAQIGGRGAAKGVRPRARADAMPAANAVSRVHAHAIFFSESASRQLLMAPPNSGAHERPHIALCKAPERCLSCMLERNRLRKPRARRSVFCLLLNLLNKDPNFVVAGYTLKWLTRHCLDERCDDLLFWLPGGSTFQLTSIVEPCRRRTEAPSLVRRAASKARPCVTWARLARGADRYMCQPEARPLR
jgi:hypothetical protein